MRIHRIDTTIAYKPMDKAQGVEKHLGSDTAVICDDPLVELIRGPKHPELGNFHKDVEKSGKGPEEFEKSGAIHKCLAEQDGEEEDGGDFIGRAFRDGPVGECHDGLPHRDAPN